MSDEKKNGKTREQANDNERNNPSIKEKMNRELRKAFSRIRKGWEEEKK
ncbi:MAG: hypothetical protein ACW98F_20380 [Candidatus Hodarchaeales archaeon]|jgi:hypothetical protein